MICITGIIVRESESVTKKALVRFEPGDPEARAADFVAPVQIDHNEVKLASTKDEKSANMALSFSPEGKPRPPIYSQR